MSRKRAPDTVWTPARDAQLDRLYAQDLTIREIALVMRLTKDQVTSRRYRLTRSRD